MIITTKKVRNNESDGNNDIRSKCKRKEKDNERVTGIRHCEKKI